jgi:hypothetical protein
MVVDITDGLGETEDNDPWERSGTWVQSRFLVGMKLPKRPAMSVEDGRWGDCECGMAVR